jgi:quercetin dioxygenase-like cupin family protein
MKLGIATAASLLALASAPAHAEETITVTRSGAQPSNKGSAQFFTGSVRVDPLFAPNAPSRVSGGLVTFEPGARSAWHTHPVGQILIVTAGKGLVQRWGRPVEEIRPGDVVRIPPGVKHWHGAAPTTGMSHIAIQEVVDGRSVDWLEQVTDEQYGK